MLCPVIIDQIDLFFKNKVKKLIIRKTEEIENWRRNINSEINFIPTMGNLHNGHIKLISTAKNDNSNVNLVSIFINPLQFDNKLSLIHI